MNCQIWITLSQTQVLHISKLSSTFFEDNESVIKIIISKGRSPTMSQVSRTYRVALDCLIDRINLDPKIRIKYVDTRSQLADMLTKETFTRDESNQVLQLSNMMDASLFSRSHFSFHIHECSALSKRQMQGQEKKEKRPIAWLQNRDPRAIWSFLHLKGRSRSRVPVKFLFH